MKKLTASATLCVGLTLLAPQAEAQHKTHSGVVHTQLEAQNKTHSAVVHPQAKAQDKTHSGVVHPQAKAQDKIHSAVVHPPAEAQDKTHSGGVHPQREYVRLAEICAFGFWCDTSILNSNNPTPPRPLVTPKAKLAGGIDRSQFRPEIASYPELVAKMTHMVFGEVGRYAPLPVKIIQLETAFNRAQARAQTLAHVLLSVKESSKDGYYAIETYRAAAEPTPEEVETFEKTVLAAVLHGSNLSDVGYGPMTGNASADVAAHQFAKGDPGYQLQAGDAYFREGPFINGFPEISPSTLFGCVGGNNAISFDGAPYCKPVSGSIGRYCSVTDVR